MNEKVVFKPVLWRLAIQTFILFYFYEITFNFVLEKFFNYYRGGAFFFPGLALGVTTGAILSRKSLIVEISEDYISGPTGKFFETRTAFPLKDLDKASINKQTWYEKLSGFHSIHSIDGEKIIFMNFIYGKSKLAELHKALIQSE